MPRPLTSFIIPSYNRAHIIKRAVQSLLAQTNSDWEAIIVDDGSTDNTKQVIADFGDARIMYTKQKNAGAAAARNKGMALANGKWIAYLDSDNELHPEYLATMLSHLHNHPGKVFALPRIHRVLQQYEGDNLIKSIDDKKDILTDTVTINDIFMRTFHADTNGLIYLRRLYDEGIRWDTALPVMEDWELMLSIGNLYPDGFLFVNKTLCTYYQRFGSDSIRSNTNYRDNIQAFEMIYKAHKDDPLMQGQTWYEPAIKRWKQRQEDYENGKLPAYSQFYFTSSLWKESSKK